MTENANNSIEQHDAQVHWRCPMLGGEVTFRYCRRLLDGMPCSHIVRCWKNLLDVEAFLEAHYDRDALADLWNRPRPDKVSQLSDLIAKASTREPKE
jgi:hypothetical protein